MRAIALETSVLERLLRGDDHQLRQTIEVAQALVAECLGRVEIPRFRGDGAGDLVLRQHGGGTAEREVHGGGRVFQRRGELRTPNGDRAHDTETGNCERFQAVVIREGRPAARKLAAVEASDLVWRRSQPRRSHQTRGSC